MYHFLAFPLIPTFRGISGARDFACNRLEELGFEVRLVETPINPIILATGDPSWPRLVIYGHYDVQPPDPLNLWSSDPFKAVEDGRLYGRGAADNKGPQIVHMAALRRVLKDDPDIRLHITYLIEGEEEIGSPSFRNFLEDNKEDLRGITFSFRYGKSEPESVGHYYRLRGLMAMEIKVTGPSHDLHREFTVVHYLTRCRHL